MRNKKADTLAENKSSAYLLAEAIQQRTPNRRARGQEVGIMEESSRKTSDEEWMDRVERKETNHVVLTTTSLSRYIPLDLIGLWGKKRRFEFTCETERHIQVLRIKEDK